MEGRRGASIVTCGDLVIAFGGRSGTTVPPTWHRGVWVLDMRSGNKQWAPRMTGVRASTRLSPPFNCRVTVQIGLHRFPGGQYRYAQCGSRQKYEHDEQVLIGRWTSHLRQCFATPLDTRPITLRDRLSHKDPHTPTLSSRHGLDSRTVAKVQWLNVAKEEGTFCSTAEATLQSVLLLAVSSPR